MPAPGIPPRTVAENRISRRKQSPCWVGTVQIAGRDTTATSLNWLFYEIARHPTIEAKVRDSFLYCE